MTPPTQSDARYPEWLVEKAAKAIHDYEWEAPPPEWPDVPEYINTAAYRAKATEALSAALSSCPVLGLTEEGIQALIDAAAAVDDTGAVDSAYSKLLATREALERGSDG